MMHNDLKARGLLLAVTMAAGIVGASSSAWAYGAEGLFGGRAQPDSSVTLGNPLEYKTNRPDRAESVLDHPRPDYDPVPVEFGSFEFFPSLEMGETYDSNIYATRKNEVDDSITNVRPVVSAFSNWGRHALSMTTFGDVNFYGSNSHEDYQNFVADMNGRYDIMAQTWLTGRGGWQKLTETRSSPEAVSGTEPTTFAMAKGGLGFYRGVGKVNLAVDYDYKRFDYNDTPSSTGPISQTGRNRHEHEASTKIGYDWSGNFKPYVKGKYSWIDFDHNRMHQSQGYETVLGATADFGGITSLDLYAGVMARDFNNFTQKKSAFAPNFGGRLEWNVTGLTSLALEMNRSFEVTTLADYSSYIATGGSATLTHELRRNILLEANVGVTRSDFKGFGDRSDDQITTGLGTRYLINRNLYTDLLYNWDARTSNERTAEFTRNMVTLRVGVRY